MRSLISKVRVDRRTGPGIVGLKAEGALGVRQHLVHRHELGNRFRTGNVQQLRKDHIARGVLQRFLREADKNQVPA